MSTQDAVGTSPGGGAGQPPTADRTHEFRWWILAVVGIAQLMVILDTSIVNIALPSAQADLGFSDGNRQWIITAYALAFGSLLLLGGRVADLFGQKRAFLTGLVGFALASAAGGAATSFGLLVAARSAQGLFGALLAPAALSLLATTFSDDKERGKAFGIFGAVAGAGGAIGLLAGGLITEYLDWRWCLYVNLVFAAVAFAGGSALLGRGAHGQGQKLDLIGTVLVSVGLFGLVFGFSNAESHGWSSPSTWGNLTVGVVLLIAFTAWQTRAKQPLLPLRLLLDRTRGASFLSLLIAGVGQFGSSLFLTYYLQQGLGYTPVQTGLAFLPLVAAMVIGSTVSAGVLVPRFGPKPVIPVGMGLTAASLVWLTSTDLNTSFMALLWPLLVMGVGLGSISAPAISMASYRVAPEDVGVASASVNTVQQIGGSIGTALLNTVATSAAASYLAGKSRTPQAVAQAAMESYYTAYWWSAGIFLAGLVISVLLYRSGRIAQADADADADAGGSGSKAGDGAAVSV
ncbi:MULTISPECIES: MFS transporter [unclassified Streptomyces]|uniref:MFS transporter n=1 Tax=unclassified Streptomyces TaxID=2593676 RepID=UPI0036ED1287